LAIHFGGPSRKNVAEELALFEEALRREPELPQAMLGVSMALIQAVLNSLADDHAAASSERKNSSIGCLRKIRPRIARTIGKRWSQKRAAAMTRRAT
jgi:hypothetical protein